MLKRSEADPAYFAMTTHAAAATLASFVALYEETLDRRYLEAASTMASFAVKWQNEETGLWEGPNRYRRDISNYGVSLDAVAALMTSFATLENVAASRHYP